MFGLFNVGLCCFNQLKFLFLTHGGCEKYNLEGLKEKREHKQTRGCIYLVPATDAKGYVFRFQPGVCAQSRTRLIHHFLFDAEEPPQKMLLQRDAVNFIVAQGFDTSGPIAHLVVGT